MSADIGYLQSKISQLKDEVESLNTQKGEAEIKIQELKKLSIEIKQDFDLIKKNNSSLLFAVNIMDKNVGDIKRDLMRQLIPVIAKSLNKKIDRLREQDITDIEYAILQTLRNGVNAHEKYTLSRLNLLRESIQRLADFTSAPLKTKKFKLQEIQVGEKIWHKKN